MWNSSSRENGNACQHSPEHGNKMYERGGRSYTPVQPYISGTGGGAHPGDFLGTYPGGSNRFSWMCPARENGNASQAQPRAWE